MYHYIFQRSRSYCGLYELYNIIRIVMIHREVSAFSIWLKSFIACLPSDMYFEMKLYVSRY